MDENTNIWNTKVSDLTVKQQLKASIAAPIIVMGGLFVPLWVAGKIIERRELRELKKQAHLTVVDEPTDEA